MKFELNNLPRNCSDEAILAEIKRVAAIVDKELLTKKDYDKLGKITSSAIQKRLGGWQKALIAAGLGHKYSGRTISEKMQQQSKNLTDEQVLNELKIIAKQLNQDYVSQEDIDAHSKVISASTVMYRFGSWLKGIEKVGLKNAPGYKGKFSQEEYLENLLNVWTHRGRQPFLREIDEYPSVISPSAYERRFGTWRKALEAFVAKMNQDNVETIQEQTLSSVAKISKGVVREEIKKHSVLSEDRHEIKLGLRYKVLVRDKFKCIRCGISPATDHSCHLHIDHKIPFSKGGKTIFENLQTLCDNCNLGKGNRHLE